MADTTTQPNIASGDATDPSTDVEHGGGKYKDPVDGASFDDRFLASSLPKAPDPSPFTLGKTSPS